MCPTDLEKELTAKHHLFPDYAQMKAHIETVMNSRTRGLAPTIMRNLSDEESNHHARGDESVESEDGELYCFDIRNDTKVFFTKSRHDSSKSNTEGGGKGKTDNEFFRCGRIGHIREDCRAKTQVNGGHPNSAPKGAGCCKEEDPETSQNVPLVTIDLGSIEVLLDHNDTVEDEDEVDESSEETTGVMPPLPPVSWFNKTDMHCGKSRKTCERLPGGLVHCQIRKSG